MHGGRWYVCNNSTRFILGPYLDFPCRLDRLCKTKTGVIAPVQRGYYILEFDMLQDLVARVRSTASKTAQISIKVE